MVKEKISKLTKLANEQKEIIRKEYATGEYSYSKLAKKYNVSKSLIYYIMHPKKYQEQLDEYKSLKRKMKVKDLKCLI